MLSERHIKLFGRDVLSCYNNLIMLFEQDDKLCKQDIKSFPGSVHNSVSTWQTRKKKKYVSINFNGFSIFKYQGPAMMVLEKYTTHNMFWHRQKRT